MAAIAGPPDAAAAGSVAVRADVPAGARRGRAARAWRRSRRGASEESASWSRRRRRPSAWGRPAGSPAQRRPGRCPGTIRPTCRCDPSCAAPAPSPAGARGAADGPYPGLRGFEQADAGWFHGRQRAVTDLLVRMTEQLDTPEPVVLVGASGSGKSSLLRAGLRPRWPPRRTRQLAGRAVQPGAEPGRDAGRGAGQGGRRRPGRARRRDPARTGRVRPVVPSRPAARDGCCSWSTSWRSCSPTGVRRSDRLAFTTALVNAHPGGRVAGGAGRPGRAVHRAARPGAGAGTPVLLGPLTEPELREAILAPARDAGVPVEPGLPDRLIADLGVRGERGYEPGRCPGWRTCCARPGCTATGPG